MHPSCLTYNTFLCCIKKSHCPFVHHYRALKSEHHSTHPCIFWQMRGSCKIRPFLPYKLCKHCIHCKHCKHWERSKHCKHLNIVNTVNIKSIAHCGHFKHCKQCLPCKHCKTPPTLLVRPSQLWQNSLKKMWLLL